MDQTGKNFRQLFGFGHLGFYAVEIDLTANDSSRRQSITLAGSGIDPDLVSDPGDILNPAMAENMEWLI